MKAWSMAKEDAAEKLAQAIRNFLYHDSIDPDPTQTLEYHDGGCAVYDAYQSGPCDCGSEALLNALKDYEAAKAPY